MRVSELCKLNVPDVDLRQGAARVVGKSRQNSGQGKARSVYIGKRTQKALWQYLAHRQVLHSADSPVIATRDGDRFNRQYMHTLICRLGDRAGVRKCYPHRFRHSFATNYLRNGGDIYTLQRRLGHTSLEMVKRYLKLAEADDRAAHRRASPVDNWKL